MTKPRPRPSHTTIRVDAEQTELPQPSAIPPNLGKTIMWGAGVALLLIGVWTGINTLRDHSKAADDAHDAQFVKTEKMKDHEREDIQSITKLAEAVNQLAVNADVGRQYLLASNKEIKASVADLALTICRQNNPKDSANVCRPQDTALTRAIQDATQQAQVANDATTKAQAARLQPPVPTKGN
jgi:hypothetical protein